MARTGKTWPHGVHAPTWGCVRSVPQQQFQATRLRCPRCACARVLPDPVRYIKVTCKPGRKRYAALATYTVAMDHAFIISCCAVSLPQCRRSAVRHPQLLTPTWTDSDVFSAWHCRLLTSTTHLPRLRTRSHPATSLDRRLDVVAEAETRHRIAVRLTKGDKELERIAWLRADAYYEVGLSLQLQCFLATSSFVWW